MAKRIKKAPVTPQVRRQWFKRYEEGGESAPEIAKADGYDVRTVRKLIETERQERERREVRSLVLRQAMEQHHADLCGFARKLNDAISGTEHIPARLQEDHMWSALKEHLPRSPIWKTLDQRETLLQQIDHLKNEIAKLASKELKQRIADRITEKDQIAELSAKVTNVVIFNLEASTAGEAAILTSSGLKVMPAQDGMHEMKWGAYEIGVFPEETANKVQKVLIDLLEEIFGWSQFKKIQSLFNELNRVKRTLKDELAIVILRRITHGKCRYCPL